MNQNTTNTKNGKNTIDFDELHEECGVFGMWVMKYLCLTEILSRKFRE